MIEIEYKGGNGVTIKSNQAKMSIDPNLSAIGLKNLKTTGDIELATEDRFSVKDQDSLVLINGPG